MAFESVRGFYKRNDRWIPILFFVLGFVFDAVMLRRIDEPLTIAQQAVYILISAWLILVELVESSATYVVPAIFAKPWKYREALLHFLMGTLLNAYTIFYFKSASALTSLAFIVILVLLLMINEFKRFGKSQTKVHVAFLSLCLISYCVTLAPIVLGFVGMIPFLIANGAALLLFSIYYVCLDRRMPLQRPFLQSFVVIPYLSIQVVFALLYFAKAIPPVPLSVSYMGIFHNVSVINEDGNEREYQLEYTRSSTKFWQHGDQTFAARPGDVIYCYARIFSPARFKDKLQVRWLFYDPKLGWLPQDAIPLAIVGGREEGFRGVTKKANYQPGLWRVQIETMDDREVGRINFTVEKDERENPRPLGIKID